MINQIVHEKQLLRQEMRQQRLRVHQAVNQNYIASQLIKHFFSLDLLGKGSVVSGYWACGSEISVLPLMQEIYLCGYSVALPVVNVPGDPLIFRYWQPGLPLQQDCMGIPCPGNEQPALSPTILLVPTLAFDITGARLGQGMGFYDKIIHQLRLKQTITAIGIAYEVQKVNRIPVSAEDEKLDYIITEKEAYRVPC